MALRIARGLFRLWLVLSVLWIGWVGLLFWNTWPEGPPLECVGVGTSSECMDKLLKAGKNPFAPFNCDDDGSSALPGGRLPSCRTYFASETVSAQRRTHLIQ